MLDVEAFAKQMTAAAKRTPEGEREKRDQVEEMFRKMREGE